MLKAEMHMINWLVLDLIKFMYTHKLLPLSKHTSYATYPFFKLP